MIKYIGIPGVANGVILWMIDHNRVLYIPIETFVKLKEDGKKSYNIKMLGDPTYPAYEIPSKKLVKFMESDYSILEEIMNGKNQD